MSLAGETKRVAVSVATWTACVWALSACGHSDSATAPSAAATEPGTPAAAAPAQPVAPAQPTAAQPAPGTPSPTPPGPAPQSIEDATFSMRLVAAGPYKANELARVSFELLPHGEFHVNQEYPFEMTLTGDPQTTLPKPKLEKGDAKVFGEKAAQFDVPLTITAAGEHKLQANVKFAVCTKENCVPDERNLALTVNVM